MITKLSHATIYVLNQDEALDFYTNKLGFEVRTDVRMGDYRWLTVGPKQQPELEFILSAITPGMMFDDASATKLRELVASGKLGMGVFETPDCLATYEELKSKGVVFYGEPKKQPYAAYEVVFKDNSGNWFSLCQR